MTKNEEWVWNQFKNNNPEIKNMFETTLTMLKLMNYHEACLKANFGYNSKKEPLLRCHLYTNISHKIFSLYYNTQSNEIFIRNKLNSEKKLMTSSEKINIESNEHLQQLLNKLIINI